MYDSITFIFVGPTRPEFFVDYPQSGPIVVSYVPTFPGSELITNYEKFKTIYGP